MANVTAIDAPPPGFAHLLAPNRRSIAWMP